MGLLDDYLNAPEASKAKASEAKGSSLLEQYLDAPEAKPKAASQTSGPDIGEMERRGLSVGPALKGGANPRDSELIEGIKNTPSRVGAAIGEDFKAGLDAIGSGTSDILNNKPASGVGKIGMGALSAIASPVTGTAKESIERPVTELTGNPTFGKAVTDVATSGLPIVKAGKSAVAALPTNSALKTLVERIGPENLPDVVRQMKENPRLTPADLSPQVKQDLQTLYVTEGPHVGYIANRVADRTATAKAAAGGALDSSLGATVNAADKLDALKANIRNVGTQKINPALANTGPVDVTPVVKEIDSILKPGVSSVFSNKTQLSSPEVNRNLEHVRQYLTDGKNNRVNPQELHDIQSALRSQAEGMLNSSSGQDRQIGKALMDVRNNIVKAIDDAKLPDKEGAAPTQGYKSALSDYRDEFHISDAFQHGHDAIIANGKAITNRPEFFERWVKNASPEELEAAKEGARVAIDTAIGGYRTPATNPASKAVQLQQVDFNRQRIEALFGKEEANKLFNTLEHERQIADTNNKLIEGSQTAMRLAAKRDFALPEKSNGLKSLVGPAAAEALNLAGSFATGGTIPGAGVAGYAGLRAAAAAKDAIALKIANERNAAYSRHALPVEGEARDQLIRELEAAIPGPKQSLVTRAANTGIRLSRLVAP